MLSRVGNGAKVKNSKNQIITEYDEMRIYTIDLRTLEIME